MTPTLPLSLDELWALIEAYAEDRYDVGFADGVIQDFGFHKSPRLGIPRAKVRAALGLDGERMTDE